MNTDELDDDQLGLAPIDRAWLRAAGARHRLAGVPTEEQRRDRLRTVALLEQSASELLADAREHTLGPAWWGDVDVVSSDRSLAAVRRLLSEGGEGSTGARLIDLAELFRRLGSEVEPGREFAVVDTDGRIVGRVDLAARSGSGLLGRIIGRVRRRRGPDVQDVVALRRLHAAGAVDRLDPALAAVARLEAKLADDAADALLGGYRDTSARAAGQRAVWSLRRTVSAMRAWARRPYGVALSGVDGSGKSTIASRLVDDLDRIGVDASTVWSRPGNRMRWAEWLMELFGLRDRDARPAVATVAEGGDTEQLPSRRGLVGWAWVQLVTVTFLIDAWCQYLRRRRARVVVFDRHLVDALVTFEFVYAGVDLRISRWACRLLPRADVTFYLDTDAATAVARKPGDTFGRHAVTSQLDRYDVELGRRSDVIVVESADTPERHALIVFEHLAGARRAPG